MFLGAKPDYLKGSLTVMMIVLAVVICWECARNWRRLLCGTCPPLPEIESDQDLLRQAEGAEIAD